MKFDFLPIRIMPESLDLKISNNEWLFWRLFNEMLPFTPMGDRISTFAWFLRCHKRWPRPARLLYQDVLYQLKTSGELSTPLRVNTADKALVKDYVRDKVGPEFNVPTIAVLDSLDAALRYDFPTRCVIKPTHLSGPVILRREGEPIDRSVFETWFSDNYYFRTRERQYYTLIPKIIVEEFVFDEENPKDFKFFCYNGKPGMIQVHRDRFTKMTKNIYDTRWNRLPFEVTYPRSEDPDPKPKNLDQMLDLAAKLSREFGFVRIDLYSNGVDTVLGEITHVPGNLRSHFYPRSGEKLASELLFGIE